MASGPLAGMRIVDLTHVWAGPLATRILADLGAEVLKVEAATVRGPAEALPGARGLYPGNDPGSEPWNRHGVFNKLNRNKKGLCLNLKAPEGRRIFLDLVAHSDVVIENFSARTMGALGLDYDTLKSVNTQIIYVAMPGYGTTGLHRDFVAYGPSVEPMTGLTSLMGYSEQEPRSTAIALPDAISGVTAAVAVATALYQRLETGEGGFVDLAMQEAGINFFGEYVLEQQMTGRQPAVVGNGHAVYAPHGTYRCRGDDHWIVIACRDDRDWRALSQLAGRDWAQQARYTTPASRRAHRTDLDRDIEAWTQTWDKLALMSDLQQRGVPAGAVMNAPEFMADPHLRERGFFATLGADHIEAIPYPGTPVLMNGERGKDWCAAPKLGEHNREVLGELLGLSADDVERLTNDGILAQRPPG